MVSPANVQKVDRVVAQQDTTIAQSEPINELGALVTFNIVNFSSLGMQKIYSDPFELGGYKWRVLVFPKGNKAGYLSMYLDLVEPEKLPHGWRIYSKFGMIVINQLQSKLTERKDTQHKFYTSERDWGFTTFMPLTRLNDPSGGFIVNGTCTIQVAMSVFVYNLAYNSTKHTEEFCEAEVPQILRSFVEPIRENKKDNVTKPKSLLQQKDCVDQAIRILEPRVSENSAKIDDQSPEVIAQQALKNGLESFVDMHQAIGKFTTQLNSQSKKLEEAEKALKTAEEKASFAEAKAAALEAELKELRAENLTWEVQIKAKEEKLVMEKALRMFAVDIVGQKATLEEFGDEGWLFA